MSVSHSFSFSAGVLRIPFRIRSYFELRGTCDSRPPRGRRGRRLRCLALPSIFFASQSYSVEAVRAGDDVGLATSHMASKRATQ